MIAPKVTVLMPVYNGEKYLHEAIESILAQTYTNFEFLIINDGSTDAGQEIIRSFSDRRIRHIDNPENLGLIATLNKGLELAKGKFIARMDQDDISLPDRLEKQVAFMEDHPEIGVLGAGFQLIDNSGQSCGLPTRFPTDHDFLKWSLNFFSPIVHPSAMMNKAIILGIGGYSSLFVNVEDYDLWIRASKVTKISNLEDILLLLRKHDHNITQTDFGEHIQNAVKVCHSEMSDRMNENIPIKVVENLWASKHSSAEETLELTDFIYKLHTHYVNDDTFSEHGKKLIRKDAGRRLFSFAYPFIKDFHFWRIFMLSIYLNPLAFLKSLKTYSFNLLKKSSYI